MTNEFDPHSPESEGQPGSLGDAFGGFMPDMPEGSWERLNDRRKKRRRGLFWWLLPAFLVGMGFGAYWMIQHNSAKESVVISTQPKIENAKEIPSEKAYASTIEKNTESKISVPSNEKQPAVNSDESRQTENQPSEVLENQPTSDRFPKGETTKVKELEASGLKTPSSNLVLTQTKKKRNKNASEVKSAIETNKMSSGEVSRKESTGKIVAFADVRSAKASRKKTKGNAANRPSEKEPNANDEDVTVQKQPNSQNEIADQNSIESNHSKLEPGSVSQAVSPKDGNEPKADSVVPPKVDSTSNLAIVPKDTVRKELAKRHLGFELSLSGLSLQQQFAVQSAAQTGAEQVLQSPVSLRPVFGGNFQFKMKVPFGAKFSLLPLLETSLLYQQMTFQKEPGASAPVRLIQTADGITGAPVLQTGTYSKKTVYLLPGAGLEAGYVLTESFELRAGAVYSWVFSTQKDQKPAIIQPGYWLAAQYQFRKRWSVKAEIRRFGMKTQLLSDAASTSENLQLGIGLVWKVK
jgi:hypothetical protein